MNNRVVSYLPLPCTLYLLSLCKKSVGWRIHNVFSILFYIKYIRPQLDYITWIMVRSTYVELLMLLHLLELNINISHSTALNAFNVIHTYIRTLRTYVTYVRTYIHTCLLLLISMLWHRQAIFKLKGDKLSSSAEFRIWNQGLRHQIASRLNAFWQTDWTIEDQATNFNWSASIQPTWPHCQLTFAPGSGYIHVCCC